MFQLGPQPTVFRQTHSNGEAQSVFAHTNRTPQFASPQLAAAAQRQQHAQEKHHQLPNHGSRQTVQVWPLSAWILLLFIYWLLITSIGLKYKNHKSSTTFF